jgi:ribosomal protein S18 acetylase RimI-like enzyme
VSSVSQVTFRLATKDDEAHLLRMMRKLAEQEPGAYFDEPVVRKALHDFLANPEFGKAWIFSERAPPAGYIVLTLGYSFEYHGRDAFVDELYVEPQYRRRGIARQAMQFLEQQAREMGVKALHLEVDHGNIPALELYRGAGYADHHRYLMTKRLVTQKAKEGRRRMRQ